MTGRSRISGPPIGFPCTSASPSPALCVAFPFVALQVMCIYIIRAPRYRYSRFIIYLIVFALFVSVRQLGLTHVRSLGTFPRVVILVEQTSNRAISHRK